LRAKTRRPVAALTVGATIVALGTLVPASPASAIPADCSIRAYITTLGTGVLGVAEAQCRRNEGQRGIDVDIYRSGFLGWTQVAHKYVKRNGAGIFRITTLEPCSDADTDRKYKARAALFDERFPGPPIEIRDVDSNTVQGHC
jgi:hypothetical protein